MLGWKILKEGEYHIDLPILSASEEQLIMNISSNFMEKSRDKAITGEKSLEEIKNLIFSYCRQERIALGQDQLEYLSKVADLHISGLVFIDMLLKDPEIEEISIIGKNKPAFVFLRSKGWKRVNACFTSEDALMDIINKIGRSIGRRITFQNPRLDTMLEDGSRLHASLPPISEGELTIRKFRDIPFSPKDLIENNTADLDSITLLSLIMQGDNSLVIAGNTASGKTTTLNALFSFVPSNERILITEETPEINIPNQHKVRLVANRDMGVSLKNLVYDSLRMRPDRTIVGEVRNKEEIEALFDVLLGGQARAVYVTMHGHSAEDTVKRIQNFGVSQNDIEVVDYLLVQKRMLVYDPKLRSNTEVRRLLSLSTINRGRVLDLVRYDVKSRKYMKHIDKDTYVKLADSLGLTASQVAREMESRKKTIKSAKPEFLQFFNKVQKDFYGIDNVG